MSEVWVAIWTGIVSGLVTSMAWFALFRYIRPRMKVAPKASWDPAVGLVRFKILNMSRRELIDIRFQIDVMRPRVDPQGVTYVRSPVDLVAKEPVMLAGKRRDNDHSNAFRVAAELNPTEIFERDSNRFIRFRVFARDTVSGVGRVEEMIYHSIDDVIDGTYAKGQTFDIVARAASKKPGKKKKKNTP